MPPAIKASLWLCLSLFVAATSWLYAHRIFNPWARYVRSQESDLIAEMGDLYSPWVATRELLLHRRNPYSSEVTHEIQTAFYGHPIYQTYNQRKQPLNEQRFAYPVYTIFMMAPTVNASFSWLRRWAAIGLGLLTLASILLYLDLLEWRLPWMAKIAIGFFVLSCPQIIQGLRLEQLGLLVGFLLALATWCVQRNQLVLAGALLALCTIKPQMSLFPLCFFFLWALGDWAKRWPLVAAFLLTLSVLIGAGELLLPGWIGYFLDTARAYSKYAPAFTSIPRIALGDTAGEILGAAILFGLLLVGWRSRTEEARSRKFVAVFSAFLIGTTLCFPLLVPFNQVILILPTLLLLYAWGTLPKVSRFVFIGFVGWPWVTSAILLFFPSIVRSVSQLPLLPSLLTLFYPVFLPPLLTARKLHRPL
jgi:hypothetical protein